jgi:hypothetical protein
MNRDQLFQRNHRLFEIFMKEVLHNPTLVDAVPVEAHIVMLPESDPELFDENLKHAKQMAAEGQKPFLVKVQLVAETRTLFIPKVEIVPTLEAASRD